MICFCIWCISFSYLAIFSSKDKFFPPILKCFPLFSGSYFSKIPLFSNFSLIFNFKSFLLTKPFFALKTTFSLIFEYFSLFSCRLGYHSSKVSYVYIYVFLNIFFLPLHPFFPKRQIFSNFLTLSYISAKFPNPVIIFFLRFFAISFFKPNYLTSEDKFFL